MKYNAVPTQNREAFFPYQDLNYIPWNQKPECYQLATLTPYIFTINTNNFIILQKHFGLVYFIVLMVIQMGTPIRPVL